MTANRVINLDVEPADPKALSVQVGHWLQENGYVLADHLGHACQTLSVDDQINILSKNHEFGGRNYLVYRTRKRRRWIGTIWFSNQFREATPERWRFDIHRESSRATADDIATKLAEAFKVDITTKVTFDDVFSYMERFPDECLPD